MHIIFEIGLTLNRYVYLPKKKYPMVWKIAIENDIANCTDPESGLKMTS